MMDVHRLLARLSGLRRHRARIIEAAGAQKIVKFRSGWGLVAPDSKEWEPHKNGNRVLGLGAFAEPSIDDLSMPFASAALPRFFVYLDPFPHEDEVRRELELAGFEPAMELIVLDSDLSSVKPVSSNIEVRVASIDDIEDVFQVLTYHGTGPVMWEDKVRGSLVEDGAYVLLAYLNNTPIGIGILTEYKGLACFSNATTVPVFRRHGAQTALINARLRLAKEHHCDQAVVETHQTFSASLSNLQRCGFKVSHHRQVLRYEFDPSLRGRKTSEINF